MELSDLCLVDSFSSREGPTPCCALVARFSSGKTNQMGKKQFMGAMRHRDPRLCAMGAVAQLLCWRWEMSGEPPPDFSSKQAWYRLKLLVGEDVCKPMSYPQQLDCIWEIFVACGIVSIEKTHAMRGSAARAAELHGVSQEQVSPPSPLFYGC
jgi:hypothetical protein